MSKYRSERTPDEQPITSKPVRPTPSPVTQVNDGYGSTPFQRKLLYYLYLGVLILFFIAFGFIMYLKIKENLR